MNIDEENIMDISKELLEAGDKALEIKTKNTVKALGDITRDLIRMCGERNERAKSKKALQARQDKLAESGSLIHDPDRFMLEINNIISNFE
jgi:hypothetical protein